MAKDKITEYDSTASNNTVCGDVNIAENSALPSDMNNFAREIMSHLKEGLGSGTPLYVDQTNNRVGINKTPTVALDVSGDANLSGNVAIGYTSTGGSNFAICDGANSQIQFFAEISTDTNLIQHYDPTASAYMNSEHRANSYEFKIGTSNAVKIDSSGNLLVSTTENTLYDDTSGSGLCYRPNLSLDIARESTSNSSYMLSLNNTGVDAKFINFAKDGSSVGSIGTLSSRLYIGNTDTALFFNDSSNAVTPYNVTLGSQSDNVIDLGTITTRFDDIYATNGTIQTSDQQEKNTITDSDLGIDFIKRLTPKSYIFNGKTRTHYGLIAQDVETVLSDISKPTSGFAGFIKSDISEEQDGSEYRYGLRYGEFIAPLIQAVKDQQATIDALTARITALENGV